MIRILFGIDIIASLVSGLLSRRHTVIFYPFLLAGGRSIITDTDRSLFHDLLLDRLLILHIHHIAVLQVIIGFSIHFLFRFRKGKGLIQGGIPVLCTSFLAHRTDPVCQMPHGKIIVSAKIIEFFVRGRPVIISDSISQKVPHRDGLMIKEIVQMIHRKRNAVIRNTLFDQTRLAGSQCGKSPTGTIASLLAEIRRKVTGIRGAVTICIDLIGTICRRISSCQMKGIFSQSSRIKNPGGLFFYFMIV